MPSAGDDGGTGPLERVGYALLPSLVSRPGNIDVSRSGTIVLQTDETLCIMTPALGMCPLLKHDLELKNHHESSQTIGLCYFPIPIQSIPSDVSKAGSGVDTYLTAYEARYMDAKWSPLEMGPHQSPVLAALTTQFQLCLFKAESNQFRGPWERAECLTGGEERHIVSMAWMQGSPDHAWLLAGTRQGEVIVWRVEANHVVVHSITSMLDAEIIGLIASPDGLLAIVSSEEIRIAQTTGSRDNLAFSPTPCQSIYLHGSHLSQAKWTGSKLVYCTPGQVDVVETETGSIQQVLLQDSGEEESCCFRPAVSITPVERGGWEVVLQDGCRYVVREEREQDSPSILAPESHLPPANEVIGALQRRVEAARGLFAKCDDGTGLTFTCHDANAIASWSFYREPMCQFGLSLTHGPIPDREALLVEKMLDAPLQGGLTHYRSFIALYTHSSKKSEAMIMVQQALHRQTVEKDNLQGALRLSTWMQREQGKEAREKTKSGVHESIVELNFARALTSRIAVLCAEPASLEATDVECCSLIAVATHSLSLRIDSVELRSASGKLMKVIGREELAKDTSGGPVDVGERCRACGSSVLVQPDFALYAKCQKGHLWKRCATSLALLSTSCNRTCSICSCESMQASEATSGAQRRLLESVTACDLCGGKLFL